MIILCIVLFLLLVVGAACLGAWYELRRCGFSGKKAGIIIYNTLYLRGNQALGIGARKVGIEIMYRCQFCQGGFYLANCWNHSRYCMRQQKEVE